MSIVRSFVVEVPVTIAAADEPSFTEAKRHLRSFFHRIETGACTDNLVFKVEVGKSKLISRDTTDEPAST